MIKTGDVARGQLLFNDEKLACFKCHSIDGSASKAGPDLFAIGDKFGRREIIESILFPSTNIAVGYSATAVITKADDEITGVIKAATDDYIELLGADGLRKRIATSQIRSRVTSEVSLMPEGLAAGISTAQFTDLIEYLVTLKQPQSAEMLRHGMPSEIPALENPVHLEPFISDALKFEHPVWFGPMPGETNAFLVLEHESGIVWRLENARKTIFAELGAYQKSTRGLLGMVIHPRFRENGLFYYAKHTVADGKYTTTIFEGHAGRDSRLILAFPQTSNVHYGGGLEFGPDGFLYIGQGDSGPQEDPHGNAQNTMLLVGKLMRIDVDHPGAALPYTIPADNPFVGRAGFRPEIWAYGFREPWRFSFDPLTQDLWVGDVGQDRYEEVAIVRKGENHGWNIYEGFERFSNQYRRDGENYIQPVFAYARKYGPSVTGGFVYRANKNSRFYGSYIFGDYESKRVFALTQTDRVLKSIQQIAVAPQRVASFGRDASGEIYVVGYEGMIYRLEL